MKKVNFLIQANVLAGMIELVKHNDSSSNNKAIIFRPETGLVSGIYDNRIIASHPWPAEGMSDDAIDFRMTLPERGPDLKFMQKTNGTYRKALTEKKTIKHQLT